MSNQDINASQRLDADHLRHLIEERKRRLREFLDKVWNSERWPRATTSHHQQGFSCFKATGQRPTMSSMTLYYFRESSSCGHWQMVDRLSINQQLMAAAWRGTR
ncbi:hypothetical protein ABLO27_15300 [Roseibium sp. SCPC15]|uniref:hypothetical protein n=1 Tax=Roseibium sp. SCP15 TaxID=3141376 RepID=UPI003334DD96